MKRILTSVGALTLMASVSFGQLIDEKNVTLTMDLQPILQLNLQGPDQIDFVFDDINDYVAGITKYGATVLKVSSSVSFDLWATGLSTSNDFLWDNPIEYGGGSAATGPVDEIPITGVEIHQYPANPTVTDVIATCTGAYAFSVNNDYSQALSEVTYVTVGGIDMPALATQNNAVFTASNATPYLPPLNGAAAVNAEKYIAGGEGVTAGCQVSGGTYLTQNMVGGIPTNDGYYFTLDYRILPGLPSVFPSANADATDAAQSTQAFAVGEYMSDADLATSLGDLGTPNDFAAPGVYTMYIKYILVQDQ